MDPGKAEIIMLYGIPLKVVSNQGIVCRAQIVNGTDSNALFEVPEGYKRREN